MQLTLLTTAPAHVAVIDADGSIIMVNEALRLLIEASGHAMATDAGPGSRAGLNYLELCRTASGGLPPGTEEGAQGIEKVLSGERESYSLDHPFRSSGGQCWYRTLATPMWVDGRRGLSIVSIDVTERKQAEAALRESEERFRELAENIREVFYSAPADYSRILYVSPAYEQIWGQSRSSLYEDPWSWLEAVHPEDRPRVRAVLEENMGKGGQYGAEYRIVRSDGTIRWIWDRAVEIPGGQGKPARVVGIAEDITERRRLEEELRQSQKMEAVGRLAGGVAHDFNNLLTVILGCSESLLDALPAPDPLRRFAADIQLAGERAASLTRQLLALSRQQLLTPVVLSFNTLVSEMHGLLHRLLGADVDLRLELDPALRPVAADPGQVMQVILNLTINARDAMPRGGRLSVETRNACVNEADARAFPEVPPGRYAVLSVSDTGHGIDREARSRIFEPFYTTKAPGKGTGLGLATVYGIVRQSRGHITVQSEVDQGTRFDVYLPQCEPAPELDAAAASPREARAVAATLLLVEDEEQLRSLLGEVLRKQGYEVLVALDGPDALRIARAQEGEIRLAVTDMVMPGMSGGELAQELGLLHPETRVLFVSGYAGDPAAQHAAAAPGRAFLQKPFTPEALVRKVREVLEA